MTKPWLNTALPVLRSNTAEGGEPRPVTPVMVAVRKDRGSAFGRKAALRIL